MFWKNHRSHLWGFLGGGFAGALGGRVRRPTNKVDELVGRVRQALLLAHPSPAPFQAGDVGRLELRGDGVGSPGARADAEILSNTTAPIEASASPMLRTVAGSILILAEETSSRMTAKGQTRRAVTDPWKNSTETRHEIGRLGSPDRAHAALSQPRGETAQVRALYPKQRTRVAMQGPSPMAFGPRSAFV
jgi:hypothetical protein